MPDTETAQEAQDTTAQTPEANAPETFDREYVEKLRAENAKWRSKHKDAEAKLLANAPLEDQLKALQAERDELANTATTATNELKRERGMRQLATEVTDPEGAYIIAQALDLISDDGKINVTKLLDTKPYLAAQAPKAPVRNLNPGTRAAVSMNDLIRAKAGR